MKFRAHETFSIRKGWLSKGMKQIVSDPSVFVSKEHNPMDVLGIGANMVKSLRYWLPTVGLSESPITPTIKKMVEANKVLRKGSRNPGGEDTTDSPANNIVSDVERREDDTGSATQQVNDTRKPEDLEREAEEFLKNRGIETPTYEQIRALLNRELTFEYGNLGRNGAFMDADFSLGHVSVTINTAHIFYNEYIAKMPEESKLAFELFIAALAKAIDLTNVHNSDQNDELIQKWDYRLKSYLQQIKSN